MAVILGQRRMCAACPLLPLLDLLACYSPPGFLPPINLGSSGPARKMTLENSSRSLSAQVSGLGNLYLLPIKLVQHTTACFLLFRFGNSTSSSRSWCFLVLSQRHIPSDLCTSVSMQLPMLAKRQKLSSSPSASLSRSDAFQSTHLESYGTGITGGGSID